MTGKSKNNRDEFDLLGYQMGLLDSGERRAMDDSAKQRDIAAQCRAADAWLAPLAADEWTPPRDLAARIEARIESSRTYQLAIGDGADANVKSPFLSGRDMLALAATITLFVGVFLPSYRQARDQAVQTTCAANLRSLGMAMGNYEAANNEYLPYPGGTPRDAVWYRDDRRSAPSSRVPFSLVVGPANTAPPRIFIDPARGDDFPMPQPAPESLDDFPDPRNISFSINRHLMVIPSRRYQFQPRTPLAGDMTPLVDGHRRLRHGSSFSANSPNHDGRGQNILFFDYSAQFHRSPFIGPGRDDIYRVADKPDGEYDGHESPRGLSDVFLTP